MLTVMLQIAYRLSGDQFRGRLKETFLVLSDETTPGADPAPEARRLSLDPVVQPRDPRSGASTRSNARKHQRESDSMSVDSSYSKKPDQTRSSEKRK